MAAEQQATRVALYARVSTERQEQEGTIHSQIAEVRKRAAAEAWEVTELYADDGFSGTTLVRPALDRLRDDARRDKFDTVLILSPDRLARKYVYQELVTDELRKHGVSIVYCNYQADDTPEGKLLGGMQGLIAEFERAKITERLRRGKLHKVNEGHVWRPRPAFGYRYVLPDPTHADKEHRKHGHLEIVEEEAPVVRDVFRLAVEGGTLRSIARELIRRQVPTRRGGEWNDSRVGNMLRNPIYSGNATYNRWKAKEPKRSTIAYRRQPSHVERPRDEWILVPVPAIVSLELQAAAQAAIHQNMELNTRNTKHDYLQAGLVFCGQPHLKEEGTCGRRLSAQFTAKGRGDGRQYRCTRPYPDIARDRTPRCCGRIEASVLDDMVWGRLVALLKQPEVLLQQMWEANQTEVTSRSRLEAELEKAGQIADETQTKLTRLVERNLEGKVDDVTFDQMQPQLIAARDTARAAVAAAQRALQNAPDGPLRWDTVREYCAAVAGRLDELEQPEHFERRKELVRTLIKQVIVYPDRVSIVGVLPCVDATPGPVDLRGLQVKHPHVRRPRRRKDLVGPRLARHSAPDDRRGKPGDDQDLFGGRDAQRR